VAQTNDMDALEANAKHKRVDLPKPVLAGGYLHQEITALIPPLRRWARVLTRDVIAAEDLLQDCLTRALEKIHLWAPGSDLRAWLFTMLYRRHISHIRGRLQHDHVEVHDLHPSLVGPPNQPARLQLRDLQRALAKLPEEQRSVILLIGLGGMGYEEAASVVNIPVGTVRSRVARGRESLRQVTGLFPTRHPTRRRRVTSGAPRRVPQEASRACS
jgi:RNA polymerase sigma factor (sigma-70 family)